MEIFAQLLDDFEDLLCALPLLWERARQALLRLGLAAALAFPMLDLLVSSWASALALLALIIAVGWLIALVAAQAQRLRRQRV